MSHGGVPVYLQIINDEQPSREFLGLVKLP
jgi:hypothetical protein